MTYTIRLSRRAEAYLGRLDRQTEDRILKRLAELRDDPYGPYSKPLKNSGGQRSSRVGSIRIIFSVDTEILTIEINTIAPRGRAYRDL